jgi:toxin FitB
MFLLDTVTVSETAKDRPNADVVAWFRSIENQFLHVSALTIGELLSGIERLPAGRRRAQLEMWVANDLPSWFSGRVLAADEAVCRRWGHIRASQPSSPVIESLIAATGLVHGLTVVTRNESDFRFDGLNVINPWRP